METFRFFVYHGFDADPAYDEDIKALSPPLALAKFLLDCDYDELEIPVTIEIHRRKKGGEGPAPYLRVTLEPLVT